MPRENLSLSEDAQRALWPAISSVIRGSQNRTLWEPPREISQPNHLTKTGNRLLFGGAMMSAGSVITAVSGWPDGAPMQIVFALGVCTMVAGNVALIIWNGPKWKGDLGRVPSGHFEGFFRIRMAQRLGRPLTEEEKEKIAKTFGND